MDQTRRSAPQGEICTLGRPPTDGVDEEPLMTFDDSKDDIKHDAVEVLGQ